MFRDALIVTVMITSIALYGRGLSHIRAARWEAPAFVLGWLAIAAARLLNQHELLMIVAAPLLVVGRPFAAILWGLPLRTRDTVAAVIRHGALLAVWRRLTGPVTVLVLHAIALWVWHIPLLFVTAVLFWWALIHGRYGRHGYGMAVFFVFATSTHTSILGALPAFAGIIWIPAGVIFMTVAVALFAAWIGESERRAYLYTPR